MSARHSALKTRPSSTAHIRKPSGQDFEKDVPAHTISPVMSAARAQSQAAEFWLQSRALSGTTLEYRASGEERPFNLKNVKLAVRLIQLRGYRFLALSAKGIEWRVVVFTLGMMSRGLMPTLKIWSSARMLDLVQESFEQGTITKSKIILTAIISLSCSIGKELIEYVQYDNSTIVESTVNTNLERAYLSAQLSLSMPSQSSPYISALMHEAGIFAAFDTGPSKRNDSPRYSGPFDALIIFFLLITDLSGTMSQLYLIFRTLSGGSIGSLGLSSLLLITLSITPALLKAFISLTGKAEAYTESHRLFLMRCWKEEESMKDMGSKGEFRQEIILFGLRQWVLDKWEKAKLASSTSTSTVQKGHRSFSLGLGVVEEGVQTTFYVLLALRMLPTTLSLGSIRLYQKTINSLLASIRRISKVANEAFQLIFLIAAYTEAVDLPNHPHLLRSTEYEDTELLNFDHHRVDGGMSLIALDLSFRYPGSDKDVLHSINLTIRPGTTLAIVGLNGGGKTTLVKVLMGLYDHRGSLSLNGHPISSYDPATIHRRTSCLFQDFGRYSFTLRENVGISEVEQMMQDELVVEALLRGGAGGVLEKVGLDGKLDRAGAPDIGGSGEIQIISDSEMDTTEEDDLLKREESISLRIIHQAKRALQAAIQFAGFDVLSNGRIGTISSTPLIESDLIKSSLSESAHSVPVSTSKTGKTTQKLTRDSQTANLSGGQWQRVALSRAFMRAGEADLVVFDEPSASLDPQSEAELFDRIHALSHQNGRRCTTIYISHRFSTVRKADQIAVIENGTISECGSHAELISMKGRYAELYNLQKSGFED